MPRVNLDKLREDFFKLRSATEGKKIIKKELKSFEKNTEKYLSSWMAFSKRAEHVYPSQGLLITPHDYLSYESMQMLPQEKIVKTLRLRWFLLSQFNHPYRIHYLKQVNNKKFAPPKQVSCPTIEKSVKEGLSLSIGDLGASVTGADKPRSSRNERYAQGPFVKLGKQARSLFVGSASPDVWNSAAAIATMAASHCMASIPRNSITSDPVRQADLAKETFVWLDNLANRILKNSPDKKMILNMWKNNVSGTLDASPEKAIVRAKLLYKNGVRTFRVYSPEPGTGPVDTVKELRRIYGDKIEIFTGQIIDVEQALRAQKAGADGIYVGVGGGGRCITGVRSGSVVDWPELVWQLRGKLKIPIIVEGGASDHVSVALLLGASGISVSRVVSGGTIESPGGCLFCSDNNGRLFKPYGGEASARTKYTDGKLLPFNIPSFVEGETTKAEMSYVKFVYPTLTYNLHLLIEDAILTMVFRNVQNLEELHKIDPSPLRKNTSFGNFQRKTH